MLNIALSNIHCFALSCSTLSLFVRSFIHIFMPDGGGYSAAGIDFKKGNANAIVSLIFAYGIAQFGWGANNMGALLSGEMDRIRNAIYVQFGLYAFMFIYMKLIWRHVKLFPILDAPIDGKLRPGPLLILFECILLGVSIVSDIRT